MLEVDDLCSGVPDERSGEGSVHIAIVAAADFRSRSDDLRSGILSCFQLDGYVGPCAKNGILLIPRHSVTDKTETVVRRIEKFTEVMSIVEWVGRLFPANEAVLTLSPP